MIASGSTIGIIGGGQLGRMMAQAASKLGYKVHIFTPEEDSPASQVAEHTTVASYTDEVALQAFANAVDVITFEFENIPHQSLALLERNKHVRPRAAILEVSRNRLREKSFIRSLGIGTAPFQAIRSAQDLSEAVKAMGLPTVLKTTEMGYDGKGQLTLRAGDNLDAAWESLHTQEAILEGFIPFRMEISVIVARNPKGEIRVYVPVQNIHKNHILDITIAPAPISAGMAESAKQMAIEIAQALKLEGLLAVEMFVTEDDTLLVNELAPRPHNSGHWTMDGCTASQFEQAIRAVCDLPLADTTYHSEVRMQNLIGEDVLDSEKYLSQPNARLHLYGKKEARKGRKMGHVNFLSALSNNT